jgi:hypothetical protein
MIRDGLVYLLVLAAACAVIRGELRMLDARGDQVVTVVATMALAVLE